MTPPAQIVLNLPQALRDRIEEVAKSTDRPVEDLVLEILKTYLTTPEPDLPAFDDLKMLADHQLWAIVYQHLSWTERSRLRELDKQSPLSDEEQAEKEGLLERIDQLMLLRSEALVLLKGRGYDIDAYRTSFE